MTQSVIKTNYPKSYGFLLRRQHGANKPPKLIKDLILFFTKQGSTVLDPFAGSNVTGYLAEKLNRRWISIELSEEYTRGSFFRFDKAKPIDSSLKRFLNEKHVVRKSIFIGAK